MATMNTTRRQFLTGAAACGALALGTEALAQAAQPNTAPAIPAPLDCDVFVYGSTPGGIAAAIQAARGDCRVILACPKTHAGGMTASGLCTTDAVRRALFGGMVLEFINEVRDAYQKIFTASSPDMKLIQDGWFYEPSVAESVFDRMLEAEHDRLQFWRGHHLVSATVTAGRVTSVELESPRGERRRVAARTCIDGTYEGDLAAAAGVPYRVGREGRDEFGESKAGIHYMNSHTGEQILTPDTGEPSPAIQAFCARSIFTTDPAKLVPVEKPATYEQHLSDYLPLLDDFAGGRLKGFGYGEPMPRQKYQLNGSIDWLTSSNCPGLSWAWPEAERNHRAYLERFHIDHVAGMVWFLQNEPRVPDAVRAQWQKAGLHADEFTDNGHWPWQIYVRQGRRIEGRAKVTQHNFIVDAKTGRTPPQEHPIAIGEHSFDIHPCHDRRFQLDGFMEGVLWYPKKAFGPAQPGQVPYGAMLPQKIDNLLVPVALSSTHIAMSVLRMEPLWTTTGQVAGLAAATAKQTGLDVAHLDPDPLPRMLKIKIDPYS